MLKGQKTSARIRRANDTDRMPTETDNLSVVRYRDASCGAMGRPAVRYGRDQPLCHEADAATREPKTTITSQCFPTVDAAPGSVLKSVTREAG